MLPKPPPEPDGENTEHGRSANWLQLEASIEARETLRYTPAGVPILGLTLQHRSQVVEAGVPRQVEMTVPAMAAGQIAGALERCELGRTARFAGFLAPTRRGARTLIFHITDWFD